MASFYTQEKQIISEGEFLKLYGDSYYLCEPRAVSGVSQNSKKAEEIIEHILKNGISDKEDVKKILAWKIGKVDHKKSEKEQDFCFTKDWEETGMQNLKTRYHTLDLDPISSYITDNCDELRQLSITDPQEVLNRLSAIETKGLGTTYLITLLYFISGGKVPIYDRFAAMALEAITHDRKPGEWIHINKLPDKDSKKRSGKVIDNYIEPYKMQLIDIFEDKWQCRDIDRALWVYGHSFLQA